MAMAMAPRPARGAGQARGSPQAPAPAPALGFDTAINFADEIEVDKRDYSKFKSGSETLPCASPARSSNGGVSLDWLIDGDIHTFGKIWPRKSSNSASVPMADKVALHARPCERPPRRSVAT